MDHTQRLSRRTFLKGAAMGVGVAVLAGCAPMPASTGGGDAGAGASGETTTIAFLTQGGADSEARYNPIYDMFKEQDDAVNVDFIWHPGGATDIQQKLLTMIAGGEAPDMYWTHTYINPGLAKRNVPLALDDLFASDTSWSRDDYFAGSIQDFQVAGVQYAMPRETTSTIMIYNKTLLEDSGAALPSEGWTWDDFVEIARTVTKGDGAEKVYGMGNFNVNAYTFVRCWQLGGDVLNEDRTQYTMDQGGSVDAVAQIQSLIHDEGVHASAASLGDRPLTEVFLTGNIGMFPQFSVFSGILPAEFEWDIAHMPHNADEVKTTRVASAGHSIYSGTEKVDAAWAWLRMVESEAAFKHLAETGLSVPAHQAVANSPEYLDPNQPPASKQIFLDALNYGRPEPVAGDWIGVHGEITTALQGVYGVSKRDPQEALSEIADRVNELIATEPSA